MTEVREAVAQVVRGERSIDQLRDLVAEVAFSTSDLREEPSPFIAEIELLLAEHSSGHWTDAELRDRLQAETTTLAVDTRPVLSTVRTGSSSTTTSPPFVILAGAGTRSTLSCPGGEGHPETSRPPGTNGSC